jgi:hypothetical protein
MIKPMIQRIYCLVLLLRSRRFYVDEQYIFSFFRYSGSVTSLERLKVLILCGPWLGSVLHDIKRDCPPMRFNESQVISINRSSFKDVLRRIFFLLLFSNYGILYGEWCITQKFYYSVGTL